MVYWVYILRCSGEKEKWHSDKVYVGETIRLHTRLKEHTDEYKLGSYTTSKFYPNSLIGLYKVEDEINLLEGYDLEFEDKKMWALYLENTITEMYMQSMGPKWKNVYGGKYHNGYRPHNNPSLSKKFNRPYCNCKIPADIKEYNGKIYWRCSKKNIYNKLQEYIVDELKLQNNVKPCKFYKEYNKSEEFTCEKLIYNYTFDTKHQKLIDLVNKTHWLQQVPELDNQCLGCEKYLCSTSGEIIGWEVPHKSELYTRPIKYKDEYISLCYDCFEKGLCLDCLKKGLYNEHFHKGLCYDCFEKNQTK